jgi:hypothetical protein
MYFRGGYEMIRAGFAALAVSALGATASYGVGLALGGEYFAGIPVGESKITAVDFAGSEIPVDMTSGWPFKIGAANFGVTSLVALSPRWGIEAGFEVHTGYYNKEATIAYDREFGYVEPEDNVKWSLLDFYVGPRFSFRPAAKIRPYVAGGAIIGRSKYELKDLEGEEVEVRSSGTAFGFYAGGGTAVLLSDKVTLSFPVKFNMLAGAKYSYEGDLEGFSNSWKPGPYVTIGLALSYAAFGAP